MWDSLRAIVVPSILWLANLGKQHSLTARGIRFIRAKSALGILVSWAAVTPWANFFSNSSAKLGLAYNTVSVFLNTSLTCMIWYQLVRRARAARRECHGEENAPLSYFNIDALVGESMLLYTLSGIAFLISHEVWSEIGIAFGSVYTLMMVSASWSSTDMLTGL